ncbi:MAG: FAD binding domain-containing protein [Vulcanimicrobiaceae bacterium]
MNLTTITEIRRPKSSEDVPHWHESFAWLAGGTWLFSEPQLQTTTLIDLRNLHWPALEHSDAGLTLAATCTIAELYDFVPPNHWKSGPLIGECCRSFLSSFKIWNEATVGGNIVMSLPAGPMISLTVSLEAIYTLWPRDGISRNVSAIEFVTGNHKNILQPGELVRSIHIPAESWQKRFAFRRASLTHLGRSGVLLIGTRGSDDLLITVTAATLHPVHLRFSVIPTPAQLRKAIDAAIPDELYFDDVHSSPAHRRHLTYHFAEEIRQELSA